MRPPADSGRVSTSRRRLSGPAPGEDIGLTMKSMYAGPCAFQAVLGGATQQLFDTLQSRAYCPAWRVPHGR